MEEPESHTDDPERASIAELVERAQTGDQRAYDQLVRRYLAYIRVKASAHYAAGGDHDILIDEGLVGLYVALRDYRPDQKSSFAQTACLLIKRRMVAASTVS